MRSSLLILSVYFVLAAFKTQAETPWSVAQCHNSQTGERLEVTRNANNTLSVETEKTRRFLNNMTCTRIENDAPIFSCQQYFGNDYIQFYSELRRERGFSENYYNFVDRELLVFHYRRTFNNSSGTYTEVVRDITFEVGACDIK